MENSSDLIMYEDLLSMFRYFRIKLLNEDESKYVLVLRFTICILIGYRLARFKNTTNRWINLTITDCSGKQRHIAKVPPGQSVLTMCPRTEHHWSARDSCTLQEQEMEVFFNPDMFEIVANIKSGAISLKKVVMNALSEKFQWAPHLIDQLALPKVTKEQLLCNTIPLPVVNEEPDAVQCAVCGEKWPLVLASNPYVLFVDTLVMPGRFLTGELFKEVCEYVTMFELLTKYNMLVTENKIPNLFQN